MRLISEILADCGQPNGIVKGMSREKYNETHRLNYSTVKAGLIGESEVDVTGIKRAFEGISAAPSRALQDAYDIGSLVHLMLLEPEQIADRVAVWKGDRRAGNEWNDFEAENAGKLIIRASDHNEIQSVIKVYRSLTQVQDLLRGHDTEVAVFSNEGRIHCKGLLDAVSSKDGIGSIVDPKTDRMGLSEHTIKNTIRSKRYREQMGIYRRWYQREANVEIEQVVLLFVSMPPAPLGVAKVKLTTACLQLGEARVMNAIERLQGAIDANDWPTFYADYLIDIDPWEVDDIEIEGV